MGIHTYIHRRSCPSCVCTYPPCLSLTHSLSLPLSLRLSRSLSRALTHTHTQTYLSSRLHTNFTSTCNMKETPIAKHLNSLLTKPSISSCRSPQKDSETLRTLEPRYRLTLKPQPKASILESSSERQLWLRVSSPTASSGLFKFWGPLLYP